MAWYDEPETGVLGMASQIPTNEWFPVDTTTGEWGRPTPVPAATPTLGDLGLGLDLTAPLPMQGQGYGVLQPGTPAIGQVAGTVTAPRPMTSPRRLDALAGLTPPQPTVWESIARGIGNLSPQGRSILQGFDTQRQQDLQNRLVLRRQQLQEEQSAREEDRNDFATLLKIGEVQNKSMQTMLFNRHVADMQARGKILPADFVETFQKAGVEERRQLLTAIKPMFAAAGMSDEAAQQLMDSNTPVDTIFKILEAGYKGQKAQLEKQELTELAASRQRAFGTGTIGDASGVTQPASTTGTPTTTTAGPSQATAPAAQATRMAPAPAEIEAEIQTQARLFNVPADLIRATMLQESYYSKDAKGSAGEIGLMQLKPGTASDMGVDPHDWKQNIRGGTKYLAQQLTRYGGNQARALAAYNQGPGRVPVDGDIPPAGQRYAQQVLARITGGAPDTRMQVAGPGAPAPAAPVPAADQARVQQLTQRIAAMDQFLTEAAGRGGERGKAAVAQVERLRADAVKERDQLLEPQRAAVRKRAEAQVEEEVKGGQTAAEALGERVTTFYDNETGEQEDPGQPMSRLRQRLGAKKVAVLSTDQSKQLSVLKQLEPVLDGYKRLVEYAYGPKGPLKDFSRQPLETVQAMWNQAGQKDPQLQAMRRSLEGQLQSVVRGLGARGDLNAQELEAAKQMLANFDASLGLGLSAGAGIGRGGVGPMVGVKPSISIPDTPETGMRVANELFDLVNKRIGSLLGKPGYARTKLLEIPEAQPVNPDDPRYGFGMIPPEVMEAKQQRARQAPAQPPAAASGAQGPPAATAVPPTSGQRALRAMTPAQLRQIPAGLARAVIANPGMEQGLSPAQLDALADGMERWERAQARR